MAQERHKIRQTKGSTFGIPKVELSLGAKFSYYENNNSKSREFLKIESSNKVRRLSKPPYFVRF
jgi:hypothetical protein